MAVISTRGKLTQCWLGPVSSCPMYGTRTTEMLWQRKANWKNSRIHGAAGPGGKEGSVYGRANTCRPISGIVDIGGRWPAQYATARSWRTSLTPGLIANDGIFGGLVKCTWSASGWSRYIYRQIGEEIRRVPRDVRNCPQLYLWPTLRTRNLDKRRTDNGSDVLNI